MTWSEAVNNNPLIAAATIAVLSAGVVMLVMIVCRHLTVWIRGWPPSHLDADGDFKTERRPDEDDEMAGWKDGDDA